MGYRTRENWWMIGNRQVQCTNEEFTILSLKIPQQNEGIDSLNTNLRNHQRWSQNRISENPKKARNLAKSLTEPAGYFISLLLSLPISLIVIQLKINSTINFQELASQLGKTSSRLEH